MPGFAADGANTGKMEIGSPPVESWTEIPGASGDFESQILSVEPIMGDAILLTVSAPPRVLSNLQPGQFFNIVTRFSGSLDPLLRRPYSVYRAHRDTCSLTFLVRPF